ncbi:MAG: hypothetical protein R3362_13405 [Rhodothermales bacterium]|nr:hypothetical protein [Rhodothermales bacterium]
MSSLKWILRAQVVAGAAVLLAGLFVPGKPGTTLRAAGGALASAVLLGLGREQVDTA